MLDLRLYRLTLVFGLLAAVILMFSVVSRPEAVTSQTATDSFDGTEAANLAKEIVRRAPDRRPGTGGDDRAADMVSRELGAIEGAVVSERSFSGDYDGEGVTMRNIVAVLPGTTNARIVIAAPRDCNGGACGASSASSTAALVELGRVFGTAQHQKTIELVSLDGSAAGAAGARELASELSGDPPRGVIVLYQPGARHPRGAAVIPYSDGAESGGAQIIESAARAVDAERDVSGDPPGGTLSELLRLAVPAGTGDQAPLVAAGLDAVSFASAGDLPLPQSADGPGSISAETLGDVGRSALALAFALDETTASLNHGPHAYIPLAGKLIPGWSLALLALALLLPVGLIGGEATIRTWRRRSQPVTMAALWVLTRAAPFLAAVVFAYVLAFLGIVPSPPWPFDPAGYGLGLGEDFVLFLLVAIALGGTWQALRLRLPESSDDAIAPVLALTLFAGALGLWLVNPFLALLCVPSVHLWLYASLPDRRGRLVPVLGAVFAGLVLPAVALLALGARLDSGTALPWHLLLMFTGGHFSALATLPVCLLAGCLIAIGTVAASRPAPPAVVRRRPRTRGSSGYSGSGSRGQTGSQAPRSRSGGTFV